MSKRQLPPLVAPVDSGTDREAFVPVQTMSARGTHQQVELRRAPRNLVLCFDGTGNQYRGDGKETNILKIFRALDKTAPEQYEYYQPGIGTYVEFEGLARTDRLARAHSASQKLKDLAVGTSLADHVLGGYKFLMRFYSPGDRIYIFGFSRGAYTAKFLAEMLDDVGLLPHGNEEMIEFAWEMFSKWQRRQGYDKLSDNYPFYKWLSERRNRKKYEHGYSLGRAMQGFRKTFSREIEPIRFLGLFDTVNSVPQFESPWLSRRSFPYTARSDAQEIWHAVSIDERRVKFRPDLIYGSAAHGNLQTRRERERGQAAKGKDKDKHQRAHENGREPEPPSQHSQPSRTTTIASETLSPEELDAHNHRSSDQQIYEVWFAGNHGDVGGGWADKEGRMSLAHVPLVWMLRGAINAGVKFDPKELAKLGVERTETPATATTGQITEEDEAASTASGSGLTADAGKIHGSTAVESGDPTYNAMMDGPIHDCLSRATKELPFHEVLRWNLMEWIPFRRMDLRNGRWMPIRWPPSRGETRDIPLEAHIHASVLERLVRNREYRPKNLMFGGGREATRRDGDVFDAEDWIKVVAPGVQVLARGSPDVYDGVYVRRKTTVNTEEVNGKD